MQLITEKQMTFDTVTEEPIEVLIRFWLNILSAVETVGITFDVLLRFNTILK